MTGAADAALIESIASTRETLDALAAQLELVAAELRKATRALEALRAEAGAPQRVEVRSALDALGPPPDGIEWGAAAADNSDG